MIGHPIHCIIGVHCYMKNRLDTFCIVLIEIGYGLQASIEEFCISYKICRFEVCIICYHY